MPGRARTEGCLSGETAATYARGGLTSEELSTLGVHIDACAACRELLSHAAELATPSMTRGAAPPSTSNRACTGRLAPGFAAGRYEVDGPLGSGGMGVVYAAHDPALGRRVALKTLHVDLALGDRAAEDLLRREAMAMARIVHPNVVAVYDLFTADETMFVAMELIDGTNLRQWLHAAPRSFRDVLQVMIAAGRGLAAAHAEGVVHRDLKPENILVERSGRVCVSDFGLSRIASATSSAGRGEEGRGAAFDAASNATLVGGTPRYMAPEQRAGNAATARSDQFSFCVVLYECLYGEPPSAEPGSAPAATKAPASPTLSGAGARSCVRECVLRGLRADPAERYASMEELLADLQRDPGVKHRRLAASLTVVLAIAAGFGAWAHARHARRELCAHPEARLAGVWDEGRRSAGARVFDAVGTPFAKRQWRYLQQHLDQFAQRWAGDYVDACTTALAAGQPSDIAADPRMLCLDEKLAEARAFVDEAAQVTTDEQAAKATTGVVAMGRVEVCRRAQRRERERPTTEALASEQAIRADLARAAVHAYLGRFKDATALAAGAAKAAEQEGDDELLARALERSGNFRLASDASGWKASKDDFMRAIDVAERAGADATRASAWSGLAGIALQFESSPAQARACFEHGMAIVKRMGGDDEVEGVLRAQFASARAREGDCEQARHEYALAVDAWTRGEGDFKVGTLLSEFAETDIDCGDLAAAEAHLALAETKMRELMPDSVYLRTVRNSRAEVHLESADFAAARDMARDLLALDHGGREGGAAYVLSDLYVLGQALIELGDFGEAAAIGRQSIDLAERSGLPPTDQLPYLALLGDAYVELGDLASAAPYLERAVSADSEDADSKARSQARFALARLSWRTGRTPRRALTLATEARDLQRAMDKRTPLQTRRLERIVAWLACASASHAGPRACLRAGA